MRKNLHRKRNWFWVFVLVVVLFGFYLYRLPRFAHNDVGGRGNLAPMENVVVSRVVDGDTIIIDKNKIRLIGIDSPELETERLKGECYAVEAKNKLKELVEGKEIRLEKDKSEKDKYDRLLRFVFVGEENINELLVREGFARLATYPPDTKYYGKLKEAERVAKENKAGLWNYCMDSGSSPE